ncbi:hypothetical protein F2P81_011358 [Scophthalmus maximus]|uniref:Uncharacterized protein n=1 Tax=Scophthalmus maximus TaxID=52904 RepID=A0A6A4SLF8_SCOMX|nr:hypothetical protein F2P81_011358 [Scophthalmus maximus]
MCVLTSLSHTSTVLYTNSVTQHNTVLITVNLATIKWNNALGMTLIVMFTSLNHVHVGWSRSGRCQFVLRSCGLLQLGGGVEPKASSLVSILLL